MRIIGSRLQRWKLLVPGTKIAEFQNRHRTFEKYFAMEENVFLYRFNDLITELGVEHNKALS